MAPIALAQQAIAAFAKELASRTPAPGGGAAAAVSAALGCAAGAMAAHYTTGPKWADRSERAQALAQALSAASDECLRLAEADASAFAAVGEARKAGEAQHGIALERAAAIPADLLALCAQHAAALADFLPACNPGIASDVRVAVNLLAGAGRAAWHTLLVNKPTAARKSAAEAHLDALAKAESAIRER
jgi:formiminotetrahydrofolate cyclodeaminase